MWCVLPNWWGTFRPGPLLRNRFLIGRRGVCDVWVKLEYLQRRTADWCCTQLSSWSEGDPGQGEVEGESGEIEGELGGGWPLPGRGKGFEMGKENEKENGRRMEGGKRGDHFQGGRRGLRDWGKKKVDRGKGTLTTCSCSGKATKNSLLNFIK